MTLPASASTAGRLVPGFARPPRLAFGGIHTESSTYSRIFTRTENFRIHRGEALANHPQFAWLRRYEYDFAPTIFIDSHAGGPVPRADYKALKAEFLERLAALMPLDGVFLAMHGAVTVEGLDDAEGDWCEATRALVGERCMIAAAYDLHGNVSRRVIDTIDAFSTYRTAPHVDVEETHIRACDMLMNALRHGRRPTVVWAPVPALMAGEKSSTEWNPGRRLWSDMAEYNLLPGILDASQLAGYVWADQARACASVVVTGTDVAAQKAVATELAQRYFDARAEFDFESRAGSIEDCIGWALACDTQPVVISDSGDNPGGGGNADQTHFLAALLKAGATNVLLGGMTDAPATIACHAAGVGATLGLQVGATLDPLASSPIALEATVRHLASDGDHLEAVIEAQGITITLSNQRRLYHEATAFRALGLEPTAFKMVVVKCGYLAVTMKPLANPALMALSPGAIDQDIPSIENRHRPPTYPWAQDLAYTPAPYVSARGRLPVAIAEI